MKEKRNLTFSEISEIKLLYKEGMSAVQLGKTFNVNSSTIHRQLQAIFTEKELEEIRENRKNIYLKTDIQEEIYEIRNLLLEIKILILEFKIKPHP